MNQRFLSVLTALSLTVAPLFTLSAVANDYVTLPPLQPNNNSNYSYNGYTPAGNAGSYTPNTSTYNTNNYSSYGSYQNSTISLRGRVSTVPQGTMLMIKLDQPVSSFSSRLGEDVTATLENDIYVSESVAIPAGSQVMGQVAAIDDADRLGRHGSIDVRFSGVKTPDGRTIPIRAHVVTQDQSGILRGDTYKKDILKGVAIAAGGTGVGTLMGLSAGSLIGSAGAGALFGLGVGAIGGMGYALARKGKEVVIPHGSRMSIILDQPVSVNL